MSYIPIRLIPTGRGQTGEDVEGAVEVVRLEGGVDLAHEAALLAAEGASDEARVLQYSRCHAGGVKLENNR